MTRIGLALTFALVALSGLSQPARAQDQKAGIAAAVNPKAQSQPPNEKMQILKVGQNVIRNERITTQNEGQVQLLFVDGSTLTLGPNSEIVIDEYVYDPKTKTGSMTTTVAAGLLRYVGGKISKTNPVNFNTPSGVITVRGGIGIIRVNRRPSGTAEGDPAKSQ